jgi:transcriptional regulator with XRE-family HTH domain
MDSKAEIREFLTTRRARITPEDVGLPTYGDASHRRVPGLRREEVALLAGVSVDYYTRLERGNAAGVSDGVLEALAWALQLDEAERAHLFDLARAAQPATPRRRPRKKERIRPSVQRMLDAMTEAPAFVRNGRLDLLAANSLGRALYAPHFDSPAQPPNTGRFVFLDPRSAAFYVDWDDVANQVVSILRSEAGRDPHDRGMSDLIGELSTQSEDFRVRWAAHTTRAHRSASPPRLIAAFTQVRQRRPGREECCFAWKGALSNQVLAFRALQQRATSAVFATPVAATARPRPLRRDLSQ